NKHSSDVIGHKRKNFSKKPIAREFLVLSVCQCKTNLEMAVLFEKSLRSGSVSAKISRKQGLFREIVAQEIHRNVCHLTSTMSEIHQ
ncbi:hypothetical protein, partial [Bifidobacterium breve]|uniref:hypothetical protein n=1 Tax=Bifidobacterium breve TaxID=1685 RepID=UPI001F36692A